MSDYPKFGSIPRLHRDVTITEKIDGTNGLISIERHLFGAASDFDKVDHQNIFVTLDRSGVDEDDPTHEFWVRAGSRNRWLSVDSDNFGFANWVSANAPTLARDLGPGNHYGEWWGHGIQRGYGLPRGDRRFSLFNVKRFYYAQGNFETSALDVVPVVLDERNALNLNSNVQWALRKLRAFGSCASGGFMDPEGIVIYHRAANQLFKVTLEDDEQPKSLALALASKMSA
jgi:hypothetical protein